MIENLFNEDYIGGMRLLLKESKIKGINIRRCTWIPNVSKILSERNLCYKFWCNVVKQGYLYRVFLCKTWYDIMYDGTKWLFLWPYTREGVDFWKGHLWGMLGLDEKDDFFSYPEKLRDMWL